MGWLDYIDAEADKLRRQQEFARLTEEARRQEEERKRKAEELARRAQTALLLRPPAPRPSVSPVSLPTGAPQPYRPIEVSRQPLLPVEPLQRPGWVPGAGFPTPEEARQRLAQQGVLPRLQALPGRVSDILALRGTPGERPLQEFAEATIAPGPTALGFGTEALPVLEPVGYGLLRGAEVLGRAGAPLRALEAAPGVARRAAGEALSPLLAELKTRLPQMTGETRATVQRLIAEEAGGVKMPGAEGEPLFGSERKIIKVPVDKLRYRPDIFQARDADVGKAFSQTRVDELKAMWDPTKLGPIRVVANPDEPGTYIVQAGMHRSAAAEQLGYKDIEAMLVSGDIRSAKDLSRLQVEAWASNYKTATPNLREDARAFQGMEAAGRTIDDIADAVRKTPGYVQSVLDAARLGPGVVDRIATDKLLAPHATEIGRGMRVYGISLEDANGLFSRVASVKKGKLVSPTALKETIDKFGRQLATIEPTLLPGFEGLQATTRGGLLGMMDDHTRLVGDLEKQRATLARQLQGAEKLSKTTGVPIDSLKRAARRELTVVENKIAALERRLTEALGGQGVKPSAAISAAERIRAEKATSARVPPLTQRLPSQISERVITPSEVTRIGRPSAIQGPSVTTQGPSIPRPILHDLNDPAKIMARVKAAEPSFTDELAAIGKENFANTRLKGDTPRLAEKLGTRAPNQVSDYLAGRIVVRDAAHADEIVAELGTSFQIIADAQVSRVDGYTARHLQVRVGDGSVSAEVQLVTARVAGVQEVTSRYKAILRSSETGTPIWDRAIAASRYLFDNAPDFTAEEAAAIQRAIHAGKPAMEADASLRELGKQAEAVFAGQEPEVLRRPLLGPVERTFATEGELAGIGQEGAQLPIGAGERPVETAGPMFARQPTPEEARQGERFLASKEWQAEAARIRAGARPIPEAAAPPGRVPPGKPPTGVPLTDLPESPSIIRGRLEATERGQARGSGKPPKEPPRVEGAPPGAEPPPGQLLARFLEGQPDVDIARSDWAKFQGGLAAEGKEIDLWMQRGSKAHRLRPGGVRTPETEQLFKALHGDVPVESLSPEMRAIYREVEPFMREQERITLAEVPSFDRRMLKDPTYFTRKWRNWQIFDDIARAARGEAPREAGRPGRVVGLPGRLPKGLPRRTLPKTFSEALEVGGEPLTWNPYEMAAIHGAELAEYRYTNVLAEAWKIQGRAIPKSVAPYSWVSPPYRAFETRPYVDKAGKIRWSEPLSVSPEDAKVLPHILGQGFEGAENAAAYLTSVFKRAKVAFGLFQYWDLQNRTIWRAVTQAAKLTAKGDLPGAAREMEVVPAAAKAWAGAFIPPLRPKLWRAFMDDPIIKLGIEEGGLPIGGLDVWKRTMRSAIEPDLVMKAPIIGELPTAKLPAGARQAVRGTQKVMNGIYRYIASGLYDSAHPQYWGAFYKSIFRQLRGKYPEWTERQVAARTAEHTNIMMSSIPDWHSVLSPRLRQLGRGIGFSVNEGEAWGRMIPRAIAGKDPELYRQQWAAYIFGTLAFAELVNYAITGEFMGTDQLSPIVMRDGRPTYNTRFARPRLDGDGPIGKALGLTAPLGQHLYLDLMGQADTPFRMLNPEFFVMTRLSPQLSTAIQELQSRTFFGQRKITGPKERVGFAAEQLLVPIPAVGFGEEAERIGMAGAGIQATGWNVSSEGLRNLLRRRFQEKYGRAWDEIGPNERQLLIMDDAELSRIQERAQQRGVAVGAPSAVAAKTWRDARDQWESRIGEAIRNPAATKADVTRLLEDASGDLAARGDVLFADTREYKPKGRLAEGLAAYNSVQLQYVGGLPDYDSYFASKDAVLESYPGLEDEVRKGTMKRWRDPAVRAAALAVFDARGIRRQYYDIPTKLGMPADRQEQAAQDVARAYDEAKLTGRPVKVVLKRMGLPSDRLMAALIYLRLPANPARKRFRLQHADELALFEDIGVGEELTAAPSLDRRSLVGVS